MFKNTKLKIVKLAKIAVYKAEEALGSNAGKQKKDLAIKYVIERLPVPTIVKPLILVVFSSFLDETIEFAVELMKKQ